MRTTLLAAFVCAGPVASADPAPKPTYESKREFALPFTPRQGDARVVEYRLFVSYNGGPFEYYTKAKPRDEKFPFRTDRDGTFSFAVQVARDDGTLAPAREQLQAIRTVVIDTRRPRIEVTPFSEANLVGGARWTITDDDKIDPRSVKLEFRWPGEEVGWQPLDPNVEFRATDSQKWNFTATRPRMEVRISARDVAGNRATSPPVLVPPKGDAKTVDNGQESSAPVKGGERPDPESRAGPDTVYWPKRAVEITYNASFGPAGLNELMLYFTEDGKKWQRYDKLAIAQKPMDLPGSPGSIAGQGTLTFDAPKDGPYGFITVVKNKVGQSGQEPGDGAAAKLNVVVDTINPEVKLIDARVVSNNGSGALLDVKWSAKDANLSRTPIRIDYCDKKDDPTRPESWKMVAEQLDNTGGYRWPIPLGLERMHVRVRATDLAGHTGEDQTREEVVVDLTPPSIEIRLNPPGHPR